MREDVIFVFSILFSRVFMPLDEEMSIRPHLECPSCYARQVFSPGLADIARLKLISFCILTGRHTLLRDRRLFLLFRRLLCVPVTI